MRGFVNKLNGRETEWRELNFRAAWDFECDDQPTRRIIYELKARRFSIQAREPGPCVSQTQPSTRATFKHPIRIDSGTVVFYFNAHHAISRRRHDLDSAGGGVSDRMSHCVFDNGLKDQVGNTNVEHRGIYANVGRESILKTDTLDLEVAVQKLDLLLECDFHRAGVLERQAQEVAEAREHFAGAVSVFAQQSRDGMQGIEEKVRVNLHLKRFQL